MPVSFAIADDDVIAIVSDIKQKYHHNLHAAGVRIGVLMAESEDEEAASVTHGGYPALAKIKIVPLKDRLTKGFDAEIHIDLRAWMDLSREQQAALIDHELSHIDMKEFIVHGPNDYGWDTDDIGRPKLVSVKGDWNAGDGFAAVIQRHGSAAIEFRNLSRCHDAAVRAKNGEVDTDDERGIQP